MLKRKTNFELDQIILQIRLSIIKGYSVRNARMMKILLHMELKENGILSLLKKRFNEDLITIFKVKRNVQKELD